MDASGTGRAEAEEERGAFPLRSLLGMEVASPRPGVGTGHLVVAPIHHNPNGVVHGAVLFALVDTAMGAATQGILEEGRVCASIDVHLRFLRPVADGSVHAEVEVVHAGRRIVQLEGEVRDDDDALVATATGAFAVISPPT